MHSDHVVSSQNGIIYHFKISYSRGSNFTVHSWHSYNSLCNESFAQLEVFIVRHNAPPDSALMISINRWCLYHMFNCSWTMHWLAMSHGRIRALVWMHVEQEWDKPIGVHVCLHSWPKCAQNSCDEHFMVNTLCTCTQAGIQGQHTSACVITGNLIVFNPKSLILCVVYSHSIEGSK